MIEDIDPGRIRLPTPGEVEELRASLATQGDGALSQLLNAESASV